LEFILFTHLSLLPTEWRKEWALGRQTFPSDPIAGRLHEWRTTERASSLRAISTNYRPCLLQRVVNVASHRTWTAISDTPTPPLLAPRSACARVARVSGDKKVVIW